MKVEFPKKLRFLAEERRRYKVAYGGRGAAKSWNFARVLLLKGLREDLRILCAREIQKTIKESVYELLKNQISLLGLDAAYDVKGNSIVSRITKTTFIFFGLRHGFHEIPSLEGVDIVWVEEANLVSKASWMKLIPTIRKDNSEIWISFNPELATDTTYAMFVKDQPDDCTTVHMTYRDNPWFPSVLEKERLKLRAADEDEYMNVWEGQPRQSLSGAVFAKELRKVAMDGRITRVPYQRQFVVDTFWDLGKRDHTSIWFRQRAGFELHYIRFYENSAEDLPHYLEKLEEFTRAHGYRYGVHYLPHDARADRLGTKMTIKEQVEEWAGGPEKVRVITALNKVNQINAGRTVFGQCYFDEEGTEDGVQRLRHYKYAVDPHTNRKSEMPYHDENSDAADAYMLSAVQWQEPSKSGKYDMDKKIGQMRPPTPGRSSSAWMRR